jgi:rfaE bifunctional protein nucleotidyltransferase chain/domain
MKDHTKILEIYELEKSLRDLSHKKIGLCHGVFDLLHIGHIKYLQEAKSLCDFLVVTITQDKNVNKGPGRPAFTENQRAEGISALECVDFVSINQWPTSIETINLIKPDFYIKGPDYVNMSDDITGNIKKEKLAVENNGGELIFTSGETHSSSTLINEIKTNRSASESNWWKKDRKKINLKRILDSFSTLEDLKVCVVGEDITDIYSNYRPLGRSSKGASLVFEKGRSDIYDGGTLAVAKNLTAFHKNISLVTNRSQKENQYKINRKDLDLGNEIVKERILDSHTSEKVIEFYNSNYELIWDKDSEKSFLKYFKDNKFDIIICVDFGHGFFTQTIINAIESLDTFVALNVQTNAGNRGYNYISKWKKADFISITAEELALTLQDKVSSLNDKVSTLKSILDFNQIVITQGAQGSSFFNKTSKFHIPAFAGSVKDRVGAGDTFLASVAGHIFLNSLDLNSIGLIGNLAAAQSLKHQGNKEILNKEDLLKAIQHILK